MSGKAPPGKRTLDQQLDEERKRLELERVKLQRRAIRAQTEALSAFQAADRYSRTNRDWRTPKRTADQAIIFDTPTLNARARQALWDDWSIGSIAQSFRRNVVGTGIMPRSNARDPRTGEPFAEFNATVDRLFLRWARNARLCDVEHRKTWVECEGLAIQELVLVGQCLINLVYRPTPDNVGLMLQMFEPEQLDIGMGRAPNGNEVRGGVEVDEFGAAVAYWVYISAHPFERVTKPVRIPADQVLHCLRVDRVRQTQGVTRLSRSLVKGRHLSMYDQYELVAARMQAAYGGFIKMDPMGSVPPPLGLPPMPGEPVTDASGAPQFTLEPGIMGVLPPGAEAQFYTPNRPAGQYEPFTRIQISQIAAGAGLDYAAVARDYSQGNFSSQRQGKIECDKGFDADELLLIDMVCRPIREQFKTFAVLEGRVEAPGFLEDAEIRAAYLEDEWQGPPRPYVNPLQDRMADKIAIDYRMDTRQAIHNASGKRTEEVMHQFADAQKMAAEHGVYLPDAQPLNAPSFTQVQPALQPADQAQPRNDGSAPDGEELPGLRRGAATLRQVEAAIEDRVLTALVNEIARQEFDRSQ